MKPVCFGCLLIVCLVSTSGSSAAGPVVNEEISIIVLPSKASKDQPVAPFTKKTIESYLEQPGWKVIKKSSRRDLDSLSPALSKKMKEYDESEAIRQTLAAGAEVLVVFEVTRHEKNEKFSLTAGVAAYQLPTTRKLASEVALSSSYEVGGEKNQQDAVVDVCEQLMPRIVRQMKAFQEHDAKAGSSFLITINNIPEDRLFDFAMALKKVCRHVKTHYDDGQANFHVHSKKSRADLLAIVQSVFADKLKGSTCEVLPAFHKSVIEINSR